MINLKNLLNKKPSIPKVIVPKPDPVPQPVLKELVPVDFKEPTKIEPIVETKEEPVVETKEESVVETKEEPAVEQPVQPTLNEILINFSQRISTIEQHILKFISDKDGPTEA